MRILFLAAAFLSPICVSANCHIPAGPLAVPKAGFESGSVTIGCVENDLEVISLQAGSTYSWVSVGRVESAKSDSIDRLTLRIESKIHLNNNGLASISSDGRLIKKGWIAFKPEKFAKIENGVVTAVTSVDRSHRFPPGEKWILIPRHQVGDQKVGPGYRYKGGQFLPRAGKSDGSAETR